MVVLVVLFFFFLSLSPSTDLQPLDVCVWSQALSCLLLFRPRGDCHLLDDVLVLGKQGLELLRRRQLKVLKLEAGSHLMTVMVITTVCESFMYVCMYVFVFLSVLF